MNRDRPGYNDKNTVTGHCPLCGQGGELVEHHYSYTPEKTMSVCDECHERIHNGELLNLNPKIKGNKAIDYAEGFLCGDYDIDDLKPSWSKN